jgi:hypothetical protein
MKRETKYTETERNEMKRSEIYRNETERNKTKWNVHKNWKGMQFSETNIPKQNKTEYVETYMPVPNPIWMTIGHNMKQARPWMLANLKIIWQFHAHPVHQKVSRFFGPRYIGDDFLLGPNVVSFNRAVVPYEISKVSFRVETKIIVSMSEEI